MSMIWHNGVFRPAEAPVFTAADRIRIGDGVFDTMAAPDGKPVHAALHFARLAGHAGVLGIKIDSTPQLLEEAARTLLTENGFTKGLYAVTTVVTRGPGERGLGIPNNVQPQIVMQAAKGPEDSAPIHAVIARSVRRNDTSPLSRIKSLNCGDNILALEEAKSQGANEAILLNTQGHVACAGIGNIFVARGEKLFTPPPEDGAMDGIVRRLLIERRGAAERSLTEDDLRNADGIYITNSLRGVRPVTSLDGTGRPAPSLTIDKDFHLT